MPAAPTPGTPPDRATSRSCATAPTTAGCQSSPVCVGVAVLVARRFRPRSRTTRRRGWCGAARSARLQLDTRRRSVVEAVPGADHLGRSRRSADVAPAVVVAGRRVLRACSRSWACTASRRASPARVSRRRRGRAAGPLARSRPPLRAAGARGAQRTDHRGARRVGDRPSPRRQTRRPRSCSATALGARPAGGVAVPGALRAVAAGGHDRPRRGPSLAMCSPSSRSSGSAATGGARAARCTAPTRRGSIADDEHRLVDGPRRVGELVIAPAWAAALFAVIDAWRRRDRIAGRPRRRRVRVVRARGRDERACFGYAALSRFLLPARRVLCVLAGVGVVRLFERLPTGRARRGRGPDRDRCAPARRAGAATASAARSTEVADRATEVENLDAVIDARRRRRRRRCAAGVSSIDDPGVPRVAAAWKLDVPLGRCARAWAGRPGVVVHRAPPRTRRYAARRSARTASTVELVARAGGGTCCDADCRADPAAFDCY